MKYIYVKEYHLKEWVKNLLTALGIILLFSIALLYSSYTKKNYNTCIKENNSKIVCNDLLK